MLTSSSSKVLPTLAIITPYRNAFLFCHQFVDMLRRQTFSGWHCVLIDDQSTDGSHELLLDLTHNDLRFTHLSVTQPHSPGPFHARNLGLECSNEDYIAFCDIDDIWHPSKLEIQFTYHLRRNLDISVTSYIRMTSSAFGRYRHVIPAKHLSFSALLRGNTIPLSTVLLSRKFLKDHRFRDIRHEDYLLWLELFRTRRSVRYALVNQVLAVYRVHNSNLTRDRHLMPLWIFHVYYQLYPSPFHALYLTISSIAFKGCIYLSTLFSFKSISLDRFLLSPPL